MVREWLASDGLRLGATTWRARNTKHHAPQVLCLAGLSRNSRDFTHLAEALAERGFDVTAMDYRGRGQSDRDADWRNYSIEREADDIDCGLDALGISRAIVVGTSRGGLHAMLLALRSPNRIAGMVLNDIGPTIERDGLHRLAGTIGLTMDASDWPSAAARLRKMLAPQFPGLDDAGWDRFARQLYIETPGGLRLDYDATLRHTLAELDQETELPDFWPVFDAIGATPLLALRGAHSDLLSAKTLAEMLRRHPNAQALTVDNEGHAPLLWDRETQGAILDFACRCTEGAD
ncbi:alpha/beta fold hydrolase [Stappia sp. ES.058]|uniref:alpha/beta fold hydrolase n=1 Tax=Stappia sp. ES.058 TaxID=1881061 RepID=UPI00087D3564|nr:alpha/beta hydrolase [Stappia sp. ES.058]SDU05646.1 Pimeloyl-ACP methyl ester carboxylesterase [Stappia sp. ES.058]